MYFCQCVEAYVLTNIFNYENCKFFRDGNARFERGLI